MTEEERNAIAGERYRMIAGVINRATPMEPGEISAWFREMSEKRWSFPPHWLDRRVVFQKKRARANAYLDGDKSGVDASKAPPIGKGALTRCVHS